MIKRLPLVIFWALVFWIFAMIVREAQSQTHLPKEYDAQEVASVISRLQKRISGLEADPNKMIVSPSQPRGVQGRLWYRPHKQDLYAYLGNEWLLLAAFGDTEVLADSIFEKIYYLGNPTGIAHKDSVTIGFVNETRKFYVKPAGVDFKYFIKGYKYTHSTTDSIQISDVEGQHWFYFDSTQTLSVINSPTHAQNEDLICNQCLLAAVYWDADNSKGNLMDERHGTSMSPATHRYLHESVGAQWSTGLAIGDIVADGDGGQDTTAEFSTALGETYDEDLSHDFPDIDKKQGLEIWYRDASGWTWTLNSGFSILTTGSGRMAWDNDGTLTEVGNNQYALCHVFAGNFTHGNPIAVVGQATYVTIISAREGAVTEISSISTPGGISEEIIPLASIIYQSATAYASAVKSRIRSTDEGDTYVDWRGTPLSPGSPGNDHGALAGLGDDDHPLYHLIADSVLYATQTDIGDRTYTGDNYVVDSESVTSSIDTLDQRLAVVDTRSYSSFYCVRGGNYTNSQWAQIPGSWNMSLTTGFVSARAGSIIAMSINLEVLAQTTAGDFRYRIFAGGVEKMTKDFPLDGLDLYNDYIVAPAGDWTFVAGESFAVQLVFPAGEFEGTIRKTVVWVQVQYD